jgi:hypothetical protein
VARRPLLGIRAPIGARCISRVFRLFFLAPDGTLMAVDFVPGVSPPVGTPRPLFRSAVTLTDQLETYAVAPDGNRFLILLPTATDQTAVSQVIVNWPALLRDPPLQ